MRTPVTLKTMIIFILLTASLVRVHANEETIKEFKKYESSFMETAGEGAPLSLRSPGRYPWYMEILGEDVLGWTPPRHTDQNQQEICDTKTSSCCRFRFYEEIKKMKSAPIRAQRIQDFLSRCENAVSGPFDFSLWNAYKTLGIRYDFKKNPRIQRVVLHLPGRIRLKALLALKEGEQKRPFVVIRGGVFSSVEDFMAERFLMVHFFEESPYNVLLVENITGPDFIHNNESYSIGGYEEGIQNIHIARWLQNPKEPIHSLVKSVHFAGISLGGNGVLFASILNELNKTPIQSFLLLCPVVNLEKTMRSRLSSESNSFFKIKFINFWGSLRLQELRQKTTRMKDAPTFHFLDQFVVDIEEQFKGGLSYEPSIQLPKDIEKNKNQFWQANDFEKYLQDIRTPILVYATKNDPLVPLALNFDRLNLPKVLFSRGTHCSFPANYDWDFVSHLLVDGILFEQK